MITTGTLPLRQLNSVQTNLCFGSQSISTRTAGLSDKEQLLSFAEGYIQSEIQKNHGPLDKDIFREAFRKRLDKCFNQKPQCRCTVLVKNDKDVIGMSFITPTDYNGQKTGWFSFLYVQPEDRGLGYGSQLFNQFLKDAEALGYERIAFASVNPELKHLGKKSGFNSTPLSKNINQTLLKVHILLPIKNG